MRWGVDRNETDNGEIVNVYFVYTESKKHEIYYNVTNNRLIRMISTERYGLDMTAHFDYESFSINLPISIRNEVLTYVNENN